MNEHKQHRRPPLPPNKRHRDRKNDYTRKGGRKNVYWVGDIFEDAGWELVGSKPAAKQQRCPPVKSMPMVMPLGADDYEDDMDIPF